MVYKAFWLLLFLPIILAAESGFEPNSAVRFRWESYQDAVERNLLRRHLDAVPSEKTAYTEAVTIEKLELLNASLLNSEDELTQLFRRVRDERFIHASETPDFDRRSTWLFPKDGCWARAALAGQRIGSWGEKRPSKLFIFGNLKVQTANVKEGSVNWWYHVVPVYSTSSGKVFVFDPAIEVTGPMEVQSWLQIMGDPKTFKASLCGPYTFGPNSPCYTADATTEKTAMEDQERFLKPEWDNLVELSRDPARELGANPPWAVSRPTRK